MAYCGACGSAISEPRHWCQKCWDKVPFKKTLPFETNSESSRHSLLDSILKVDKENVNKTFFQRRKKVHYYPAIMLTVAV